MTGGRKPDEAKRARVVRLRARGLTLAAIAQRLGISRQRVFQILLGPEKPVPLRCSQCDKVITMGRSARILRYAPLRCPQCVMEDPASTFAERLRSHRLAAGSSLSALARRAGIPGVNLGLYEEDQCRPHPKARAKLNQFFGVELIAIPPPTFTRKQIRSWAMAHYDRTGCWPSSASGRIPEAPGETWQSVATALAEGQCRLTSSSLDQVLDRIRKRRLTKKHIRYWARAHFYRTGSWPTSKSGPILEASRETWQSVATALAEGQRGLRRSSLKELLDTIRKSKRRRSRRKPSVA